jgi:hypothetical protein
MFLEDLPFEIIVQIVEHLSGNDVIVLSSINKHFYENLNKNYVWNRLAKLDQLINDEVRFERYYIKSSIERKYSQRIRIRIQHKGCQRQLELLESIFQKFITSICDRSDILPNEEERCNDYSTF